VLTSGTGGSGIVIFRYLTNDLATHGVSITGGAVSQTGSYTVHTFTSTGSVLVSAV
jgi:hypothetical protein